jgi:multidrug resistance efflux pump
MNNAPELNRTPPPPATPERNGSGSLSDRVRSLRLQDRSPGSGSRAKALPWALCVILLGTTAAFGYRAYRTASEGPAPSPAEAKLETPAVPTAETGSVASSGDVVLQAKGYIIPAHQIQVSPKVPGMIVKLHPRFEQEGEGSHFQAGEVLAELEDVDYKAERDQALHALAAARERYDELKTGNRPEEIKEAENELEESKRQLEQMRLELDRSMRLTANNAMAQRDYEQARYGHDAMAARVRRLEYAYRLMKEGPRKERIEAALAELKQAEANLAKAEWRLDNCKIRAPISGTILTKKAEKGNIVNPVAFNISASLCDMADLSEVEVDLSIQERDIASVQKGQPCTVMPEAYQNHQPFRKLHPNGYEGVVSRLMPTADRAKGAIPVRVKILNIPRAEEGVFLKPEMGVLVSFKKS